MRVFRSPFQQHLSRCPSNISFPLQTEHVTGIKVEKMLLKICYAPENSDQMSQQTVGPFSSLQTTVLARTETL